MSIYSNVSEQDLNNLRKLAQQQKEQRALKIKSRILKETHDNTLAESLPPITKKLDEVNKTTQESPKKLDTINESFKELNSEINIEVITTPSILLQKKIDTLSEATNSLKLKQDKYGNLSILGAPLKSLGGDKLRVHDNIYEFNPEIHTALSRSTYSGKSMKNKVDRRTLYNFLVDVGFSGIGDEKTNQKKFFVSLFKEIQNNDK